MIDHLISIIYFAYVHWFGVLAEHYIVLWIATPAKISLNIETFPAISIDLSVGHHHCSNDLDVASPYL